jgi:hypothetical protein
MILACLQIDNNKIEKYYHSINKATKWDKWSKQDIFPDGDNSLFFHQIREYQLNSSIKHNYKKINYIKYSNK